MVAPSQNDENQPLLKTNDKEWSKKLLKWPYIILFGILLLGAIFLLYILTSGTTSDTIKTKNSLHISSIATTNGDYLKQCASKLKCDPNSKYRTVDGTCNNLEVPTWGAAVTPFLRLINANFDDGYYSLRLQKNGSELPGARVINIKMFLSRESYKVDENNVLLMPFGQLIAHDISGLPNDVPKNENNQVTDCCVDENAKKTFSQCQLLVTNPPDDPLYAKHNITCMGLVRSITSRNYSCPLYPTTFMNINTHFIDASEVYGSKVNVSRRLRAMEGGQLNFTRNKNGEMFCPFQQKEKLKPAERQNLKIQYDTGDPDNGNQNLGITAMQTLFLRFHNYIAFKLSYLNPEWSDEILYQESRRIVIATIQRIAYQDFLPIIIGSEFQEIYGINKENIYDPTIDPSMSQEMSSAAIRILHTLIPVQFNFMNKDYEVVKAINITDLMPYPDMLPDDDNFVQLLKGLLETPGRITQPSYNFFISSYVFSFANKPKYTGRDLLSIDIVRGRDVGLAPYNQYRNLCGLKLANDFEDLTDLMHIQDINKLKELYHSVDDIDLMVGIILEKKVDDGIIGPTARCIIADGFYRFKAGDRFFYDVQGQPGSFSPDQLKTIKKITLGHVLCATTNLDHVQQDIFKLVNRKSFPTSKLKCDDEFTLDFKDWKEPIDHREL